MGLWGATPPCRRVTRERCHDEVECPVSSPYRILVIDDDRTYCLWLSAALEEWAEVRSAETTEQACDLLEHWKPDTIVLDPAWRNGDAFAVLTACAARPDLLVFCPLRDRQLAALRAPADTVTFLARNRSIPTVARAIRTGLAASVCSEETGSPPPLRGEVVVSTPHRETAGATAHRPATSAPAALYPFASRSALP